jgi:hypothetical protein
VKEVVMNDRHAEAIAYAVAAGVLVVGGALLRTVLLNWFVGPVVVVLTVALLVPRLSRDRERAS